MWDEWLLTASDHGFASFLTGPMHDYFMSQAYFETHAVWPLGERSHGKLGVLEAYSDILGVALDESTIKDYLKLMSRRTVNGHAFCPCNSGLRIRKCHQEEINQLREKLSPELAKKMLGSIVISKKP